MIYRALHHAIYRIALLGAGLNCAAASAQTNPSKPRIVLDADAEATPRRHGPRQTASIHWQGVPLHDTIARLQPLFDDTVFMDRRVDRNLRVTLDIEASSAEQVLTALAPAHELGVGRLGKLVYLGPSAAAGQLRSLAALRSKEIARLPAEPRTSLSGRKQLTWPRLTEPRQLVSSIAQQNGWRVTNAERIPYDLWAAGELPELTAAEQLTVLLLGFDLTFELQPGERSISIVPLAESAGTHTAKSIATRSETKTAATPRPPHGKREVYTLRVQEKPVGAVLKELSQRLHWAIRIDDEAIRAAGKSLDKRVSFSVENADQDKLLDALLTPAGLEYHLEGEQIRIIPGRYAAQ